MTCPTRRATAIGLLFMSLLMTSPAPAQDGKAPDYQAIVAAPDRSDTDRQTDQRREPAKILAFTGVKEGMKVLDMEANAGYSTELLARAVAPYWHSLRAGPVPYRIARQRQVRQSRQKSGDEECRARRPGFRRSNSV
jgi:predicted methyltransferase